MIALEWWSASVNDVAPNPKATAEIGSMTKCSVVEPRMQSSTQESCNDVCLDFESNEVIRISIEEADVDLSSPCSSRSKHRTSICRRWEMSRIYSVIADQSGAKIAVRIGSVGHVSMNPRDLAAVTCKTKTQRA